jgi:hypothetical protein
MSACLFLHADSTKVTFFDQESIKHFDAVKLGHTTIGIDGSIIHDMLWVIDITNSIQDGTPHHDTQHTVKKYYFENKPYSLQELVALETQHFLKDEQLLALQKTLNTVKEDIKLNIISFMQQLVVKAVSHTLIEQWAEQSERQESLLKIWIATDKNSFDQVFNDIKSAEELNLFLTDLKNFLSQVIISCPRAWKEFLDHNQEYKEQTSRKKDATSFRS